SASSAGPEGSARGTDEAVQDGARRRGSQVATQDPPPGRSPEWRLTFGGVLRNGLWAVLLVLAVPTVGCSSSSKAVPTATTVGGDAAAETGSVPISGPCVDIREKADALLTQATSQPARSDAAAVARLSQDAHQL